MEIHLLVQHEQYCLETVEAWQYIWRVICDMCYLGKPPHETIIIRPGAFEVDDEIVMNSGEAEQTRFYEKRSPINDEQITLDSVWKVYSAGAGPDFTPHVVPEFTRLHVPACLFYSLGVERWFAHSFPNCKVTFWDH